MKEKKSKKSVNPDRRKTLLILGLTLLLTIPVVIAKHLPKK